MTHPLHVLHARTSRIVPRLHLPAAQNDNDDPDAPASAAALRPYGSSAVTATVIPEPIERLPQRFA